MQPGMDARRTITLSVLLCKQGNQWVARSLEQDVAGQGDSIDQALESLSLCFITHLLMNVRDKLEPMHGLRSAPEHVWETFKHARRLAEGHLFPMPDELPEELREAMPEPWQLPSAQASDLRVC